MEKGKPMAAAPRAPGFHANWWLSALIVGACALAADRAQAESTVARFRVTVDMVASCTLGAIGVPADATGRIARLRVACSSPVAYAVGLDAGRRVQGAPFRSIADTSFIEARAPGVVRADDSRAGTARIFAVRRPGDDRAPDRASPADGESAVGILVSY